MKKKMINERTEESIELCSFCMRVDSFVDEILFIKEKLKDDGYTNIDIVSEYGAFDRGVEELKFYGEREETSDETKDRIAKEKRAKETSKNRKQKAKDKRRRQYERLSKEFGGK